MSLRALEAEILAAARQVSCNSRLRQKDIQEWTTGEIAPHDGEVVLVLPLLGVNVAIPIDCDKRKKAINAD